MYDSINLPLSPKKVTKKSLPSVLAFLILGAVSIGFGILMKNVVEMEDTVQFSNYFIFGGILLALVCSLGVILYQYLYYKLYYYEFEETMAEIRKGVVSQATGHVYYKRIQNVYVDQDVLDRIFGIYDVHYETAGETSGFYSHVDGLTKENKDKLISFLNKQVMASNSDGSRGSGQVVNSEASRQQSYEKAGRSSFDTGPAEISRKDCPISPKLIIINTIGTTIAILFVILMVFGGIMSENTTSSGPKNFEFILFLIIITSFIVSFIINYAWYNNFNFTFGSEKGEIFTKVFGQNTSFLYYDRIQNVNVSQGIIGRIFGLYNVMIETAGESSSKTLSVPGLAKEDANKLKDYLLSKSRRFNGESL